MCKNYILMSKLCYRCLPSVHIKNRKLLTVIDQCLLLRKRSEKGARMKRRNTRKYVNLLHLDLDQDHLLNHRLLDIPVKSSNLQK